SVRGMPHEEHTLAFQEQMFTQCAQMVGIHRRGCIFGTAVSAASLVKRQHIPLRALCHWNTREDQRMCLDGALTIEGLTGEPFTKTALAMCQSVDAERAYCLNVARHGFYGPGVHDYSLYTEDHIEDAVHED